MLLYNSSIQNTALMSLSLSVTYYYAVIHWIHQVQEVIAAASVLKDFGSYSSGYIVLRAQDEEYCCIHSSANTNSVLLLQGEPCTTTGLVQLVSLY